MKLCIVLLAILGLTCAAPTTKSLKDDLDDLLALIPKEELIALYHKYENDADVVKVIAYLKSDDFAKVVHICAYVPEVVDVVNFIQGKGVPIVEVLNKIADRLGLPHWPGSYTPALYGGSTRGWRDFLEEAEKIVPIDKMMSMVIDKLANSEDFGELYEKIASVDYQKLHDNALSHPEIADLIKRAQAMGVDTKKIWDFVKSFFGWDTYESFSTRTLRNDIDDILALIPKQKMIDLYHKYENDPDVVKIVAYLKSDDFAKVVHICAYVPEVVDIVNYLQSKDIHIVDLLNKIADRLGLPHWPGSYSYTYVGSNRTWQQFVDEAKKIVPIDQIVAVVMDKLANSQDFGELYEKIASVDGQKLHDHALSHPEIADLIKRAQAMGLDTKKLWETAKDFFGW